ncbi:hypothetical protein VOLCADRAFT_95107 [Volvox carteri f. nagariensis]|uniref:Uncharacterized protein n=1 Tax=Volvox carteri f. nagariensis TaxID=3068 RepID=D8U6L9_VOLCA|nr:uncharacterized protein VOLCADRAFT_95107 [Volvox carteri f. nagariensis]EFJ44668.1 hypothetical protein VOLCADRAFT_95107 [Volvox carteri f. nagariensis]|eukprot:XP_002954244.1 hypothetical protein VOLCADRAFT_95107 [Volvox carteri f. nagariensis]
MDPEHPSSSEAQQRPIVHRLAVEPLRRLAQACWSCGPQHLAYESTLRNQPQPRQPQLEAGSCSGFGADAAVVTAAGWAGTAPGHGPRPSVQPTVQPPQPPLTKHGLDSQGQWRVVLDVQGELRNRPGAGGGGFSERVKKWCESLCVGTIAEVLWKDVRVGDVLEPSAVQPPPLRNTARQLLADRPRPRESPFRLPSRADCPHPRSRLLMIPLSLVPVHENNLPSTSCRPVVKIRYETVLTGVRGLVLCEGPSRSLHSFAGGLQLELPPPQPPVTMVLTHGSEPPGAIATRRTGREDRTAAAEEPAAAAAAAGGGGGGGGVGCGGGGSGGTASDAITSPPAPVPLAMDNLLLRGCVLKNSPYVFGLAIYCGNQTRIQMNAVRPSLKAGLG